MLESETPNGTCADSAGRRTAPPTAPLDQFPDTQWTWIRRASSEERGAALGVLCRAYWYPVYCFLRRCGASPSDAADVTQDFFGHLMETNAFSGVEPRADARFRSWLRTLAKRYFLNWIRRARTDKNGGKIRHVALEGVGAEQRLEGELMHLLTPDRLFDRCWARTVTERARERLHATYSSAADVELMNEAVAELSGNATPHVRAPDSSRTPVPGSERTRKSRRKSELLAEYKKCLRREIHGTVGSPALIDHEIRLLLDVLPCPKTS